MREILFRGKRNEIGDWVEGSLIVYPDGDCYIACPSGDPSVLDKFCIDPATVGQYTGLTDKNGKRIFEGDIIQSWNKRRGKVKYGQHTDCEYGVDAYGWYFFDGDSAISLDESWASHEVIGNIHNNPELMGGEEDG